MKSFSREIARTTDWCPLTGNILQRRLEFSSVNPSLFIMCNRILQLSVHLHV